MTFFTQGNIDLTQPESLYELPPNSQLVSKWSNEDVEQFFDTTKLCDVCRVIFGSLHLRIEAFPASENHDGRVYQHHTSYESLLHSLNSGCDICTMAHNQWTKNNSRDIGFLSSQFRFFQDSKMRDWIEIKVSDIEPGYESMFEYNAMFRTKTCQNHLLFFHTTGFRLT